ncbi:hypothetical protein HYFRA_00006291 [Hymenoscyphus fraxineus]|uniref:Uncharacterized protein n=1 Tax=Hymenoscyphus fraxineus TaxID=746836 RepID=A0A9N9L9V8_9HELO|nr:hypothetical protein HYFRA_00006291 [Hymenoscyphus fraxineus]
MASSPIYPLYEKALTLHRASPLYTGLEHPLERADLQNLARKFRDILAGEVLRGVQVGLDPDSTALGTAGALRSVVWGPLPYEERWEEHNEENIDNDEDTGTGLDESRGLLLTITYEKSEYTAVMLRDTTGNVWDTTLGAGKVEDGFESFPLLLCKMPTALRDTFVEFLATTFDARVSALRFPNNYIMGSFEQYVSYVCIGEDGEPLSDAESNRIIKKVMGAVEVQIGFEVPGGSAALKSITMKLTQQDLPRIIAMGKKMRNTTGNAPFFDAMVGYVNKHLAMDLTHDRVKNTRIACDAFVLGAEGRVKFIYPGQQEENSPQSRATKRLVHGLIAFAKGSAMGIGEP